VPSIANLIVLNTNSTVNLGVLMELYMSDREDMGEIPQHPEIHVSDGFEIDPDRILSEPHKTQKYALMKQLKAETNVDTRLQLESAISIADANLKAKPLLVQRKQKAWGPYAHIDPKIYDDFTKQFPSSNPIDPGDQGPVFDLTRLSESELQLKLREAQAVVVNLQAAYNNLPRNKGGKVLPGPSGRGSAVFTQYTDAAGIVLQMNQNISGNNRGMAFVRRGPLHAQNKKHTMFEDGETALMALYAVLSSAAAGEAFTQLQALDEKYAVTIHSYSAPLYVTRKPTAVQGTPSTHTRRGQPIEMRSREGSPQGVLVGESFEKIDYVTTSLGRKGTDVRLITHYPVPPGGPGEGAAPYVIGAADVLVVSSDAGDVRYGFPVKVATGNWLTEA